MKLLIWVAFFAVSIALPSFIEDWIGSKSSRFGRLTETARKKLKQTWGEIDLDARKERIQRLASRGLKRHLSPKQKVAFAALRKKVKAMNTKGPYPDINTSSDPLEINQKIGVGDYLYEGDIFLTESQLEAMEQMQSNSLRKKRQATILHRKWTNNTVYYYFDPSINDRKRTSVLNAYEYIRSRTCINFVENSTAESTVKIFSGSGCYATVGMSYGDQSLSLGDGCESLRVTVHETFHTLGVYHMQSRSDRDDYVIIDLSDVPEEKQNNFNKYDEDQVTNYTPYELASSMHYVANAFTEDPENIAIMPVDEKYLYTMGGSPITMYDIMIINAHYKCNEMCPAATSANCKNRAVPNPRNCTTCNCPAGYGGALCDQRPLGCGATLTATSEWQTRDLKIGIDNTTVRDVLSFCHDWITAPPNTQIEVRMTHIRYSACGFGCRFNGLEFKTDADPQKTNLRICCEDSYNIIYKSELNPMPVIYYHSWYLPEFTFEYRYVPASPTTTTIATTTTTTPLTTTSSTTTNTTTTPTSTTLTTTTAPSTTTTTPLITTTTTTPTTTTTSTTTAPTTTTSTTTPVLTATTKTTTPATTTPKLITQCRNIYPDTTCSNMDKLGFCSSTTYTFQVKKYNCGKYCGLCGKKANPCVDIKTDCAAYKAEGKCNSQIPMVAEYNCAKTCGFCDTPN